MTEVQAGVGERATVAVQRVASYDPPALAAGVERAVAPFGGWQKLVSRGDRVLVKPNCISSQPVERPAQTHPALIVEVCRQLLDAGAKPLVGDSPAWGSLHAALDKLGVLPELDRLGVPVVPFRRPVRADNPRGQVFTRLTVDAAALEADAIVNLPKLKAHRQLLLTLVIKNMFGCVSGRRKAWWHVKAGSYANYFGLMLVETFMMLRPAISILDGIVAMEGNGPIKGEPRPLGVLLAGVDGPAVETVAAAMVGVEPAAVRTLAAARELNVGITDLSQIDVVGADLASLRVHDFALPKLLPIGFSIPRLVKGTFKNAWLTHQQNRRLRETG